MNEEKLKIENKTLKDENEELEKENKALKDNLNKVLAERAMYKSDNQILRQKSRENDKKYMKILEEKNKRINYLEKEQDNQKNKQIDIFN